MIFLADKRPHFINFQVRQMFWQFGSFHAPRLLSQTLQDSVGADAQDTGNVTDTAAIHRERNNQAANLRVVSLISVMNDELATTALAAKALFPLHSCAILLDASRGASRTSDL